MIYNHFFSGLKTLSTHNQDTNIGNRICHRSQFNLTDIDSDMKMLNSTTVSQLKPSICETNIGEEKIITHTLSRDSSFADCPDDSRKIKMKNPKNPRR